MSRKKTKGGEPERHRLSLAELAAHDDVCSDVMVDNVRGSRPDPYHTSLTFLRHTTNRRYERTEPSTSRFEVSKMKRFPGFFCTR
jgi:hypothetical protein